MCVAQVPGWRNLFDGPISDDAPLQRADKARRNDSEWPEKHPQMKEIWKEAVKDVKAGKRWTLAELRGQVSGPEAGEDGGVIPMERQAHTVRWIWSSSLHQRLSRCSDRRERCPIRSIAG